MDSIPYNFIEEVILRTSSTERSSFVSLQGHWGRYAKLLVEETDDFKLFVNLDSLPDLYSYVYQEGTSISAADILQRKRTNLRNLVVLSAPGVHPGAEKITDKESKM
uniref:Ras-associating domain-containing protein n=1 Tax=Steinernema glaseri TaxID=37863 RepID=A0A1I7XY67_9BILA